MVRPFTPSQKQALRYLHEGWRCECAGTQPAQFGPLVWYRFEDQGHRTSVAGSTLASLQRRGFIAWEATTLTLAYDGSPMPGQTLILTATGQQAAARIP